MDKEKGSGAPERIAIAAPVSAVVAVPMPAAVAAG
jgi:hypothetical protein